MVVAGVFAAGDAAVDVAVDEDGAVDVEVRQTQQMVKSHGWSIGHVVN